MGKIADLFVKLGLKNDEFDKGIDKSKKKVAGFKTTMKSIGGAIAGAFAVRAILDFTKQVIMTAGEAEGVEDAFNRIADSKVFDELKKATSGTVSNLELMRKTVQANNLGVPVANLGKLFKFATARAAETGESVDFLVNSIVLGIGRKSPLILDNLGISAIALREKLGGVGTQTASVGDIAEAVGKIADEALNKIGNSAITNGQKIQGMSATWDNIKLSIGKAITESKLFTIAMRESVSVLKGLGKDSGDEGVSGAEAVFKAWKENGKLSVDFIKEQMKSLGDQFESIEAGKSAVLANNASKDWLKTLVGIETSGDKLKKQTESRIKLFELLDEELKKQNGTASKADEVLKKQADTIKSISEEIDTLKKLQETASSENLANINREIKALSEKKKALEELGTITIEPRQAPVTAGQSIVSGVTGEELPSKITSEGTFGEQILKDQQAFIESFRQFNEDAAGLAVDFISDTVEVFASGLGELFAGDLNVADFGKMVLQGIGNFLSTLGKMMIQFGVTALAYSILAKALSNPVTAGAAAVGMIVAGSALVAIGSAISSASSGGSAGSSGGVPITTIDTRGGNTSNVSNSIGNTIDDLKTVKIEMEVKNSVLAGAVNLGQKDLLR